MFHNECGRKPLSTKVDTFDENVSNPPSFHSQNIHFMDVKCMVGFQS
jgi:hypothetical protein